MADVTSNLPLEGRSKVLQRFREGGGSRIFITLIG